jgi:adenylosuccinate synthase
MADRNKKVTVVIGGQFGSEAKGKVISFLSNEFDVAVRTGSPNAGHTVIDKSEIYRLQQIPATFLNKDCILCIGAGALINPDILKKEVEKTNTKGRLFIDPQAGIIEEKHIKHEGELVKNIGSTGKGCGAALSNRIWRKDFRLAKDVFQDEYKIADVSEIINKAIDDGKSILVEGTQGFGLSIYHGIYPYVTSRDTTASNFLAEAGISPLTVKEVILVIRTYPIRVAGPSGPLPYEISWEDLSKKIGKDVIEMTTVTGKVRRVAEFDIEIVKKAIKVNRPTQIALQFLNYLFPKDENKTEYSKLSNEAKKYIEDLEIQLSTPITLIGTGQASEAMIDRR